MSSWARWRRRCAPFWSGTGSGRKRSARFSGVPTTTTRDGRRRAHLLRIPSTTQGAPSGSAPQEAPGDRRHERMAADDDWDPRLRQLGDYIRLQRRMADLSLRQLAELTHVSNAYLSQIERGLHQPSLRVLRAIADALNLSADALLTQAGLVAPAASDAPPRRDDTEKAIMSDPELTPEERDVLLRL